MTADPTVAADPVPTVDYQYQDGIARIWLNRPHRLNAVIPEMVEGLCRALDHALRDSPRALILAGRGRAFCAGHDLRHEEPVPPLPEERRRLQRIQDVTRKIRQAPFVVIGSVHGYALGAGCEFALACDLVVAAEDAVFGFPEVGVGLSVTGGISHLLPAALGLSRAKELVLLGEHFSAAQALDLHLVNLVVGSERREEAAADLAQRVAARPPHALARAKFLLDRGSQAGIDAAFELEVDSGMASRGSDEAAQAARAFRGRSRSRREAPGEPS